VDLKADGGKAMLWYRDIDGDQGLGGARIVACHTSTPTTRSMMMMMIVMDGGGGGGGGGMAEEGVG